MRRLVMLFFIVFLVSVPVLAADGEFPKAEVFGGFSLLSVGEDALGERMTFKGFQASIAGNFHKNVGIVADFGGQYKSEQGMTAHMYEFLFGPRLTHRMERANVFVHGLFGGLSAGGEGESDSGFAMGFGGGIDINVNERFAVRIVQFDWVPVRINEQWFKDNVRFGFGIIIK